MHWTVWNVCHNATAAVGFNQGSKVNRTWHQSYSLTNKSRVLYWNIRNWWITILLYCVQLKQSGVQGWLPCSEVNWSLRWGWWSDQGKELSLLVSNILRRPPVYRLQTSVRRGSCTGDVTATTCVSVHCGSNYNLPAPRPTTQSSRSASLLISNIVCRTNNKHIVHSLRHKYTLGSWGYKSLPWVDI